MFSDSYNLGTSKALVSGVECRYSTTDRCRDLQKIEAFRMIDDVIFALELSESIKYKSCLYFSNYRNHIEKLWNSNEIIAACLGKSVMEQNRSMKRFRCSECSETFSSFRHKRLHKCIDSTIKCGWETERCRQIIKRLKKSK